MILESAVSANVVLANAVAVGTSRVPLSATSVKAKYGFVLKADLANTGTVYVGGSDVTTAGGYPLAAGQSVQLPIEDLANMFAVASASAQSLRYLGC